MQEVGMIGDMKNGTRTTAARWRYPRRQSYAAGWRAGGPPRVRDQRATGEWCRCPSFGVRLRTVPSAPDAPWSLPRRVRPRAAALRSRVGHAWAPGPPFIENRTSDPVLLRTTRALPG